MPLGARISMVISSIVPLDVFMQKDRIGNINSAIKLNNLAPVPYLDKGSGSPTTCDPLSKALPYGIMGGWKAS